MKNVDEIMQRIKETAEQYATRDGEVVKVEFGSASDFPGYRANVKWLCKGPVIEETIGWGGTNLDDMETWLRAGITARKMEIEKESATSK